MNPHQDAPLITASHLTVRRKGRELLSHVNVAVHSGEIVTIIGPNGAGKTTLVRALLGLIRPDDGQVVSAPGLTIGYVPQRVSIDWTVPLTVDRFLTLTHRASKADRRAALEETGVAGLAGSQMSEISGGEFQRVMLARALLNKPKLLVLDEPVQGVDVGGEASLYALIGEIRSRQGCGVLMVSHDLHVVLGASDRVICLNGHVCCEGVPEAISKDPEYIHLFGESAGAFGLYRHHHDHHHDLAGNVIGAETANENDKAGTS